MHTKMYRSCETILDIVQSSDHFSRHVRHKGGQVSPQNTEVTQFVSSDIDIQADQTEQSSSVAILQGRQGTPAGKLPPLKSEVRSKFE